MSWLFNFFNPTPPPLTIYYVQKCHCNKVHQFTQTEEEVWTGKRRKRLIEVEEEDHQEKIQQQLTLSETNKE